MEKPLFYVGTALLWTYLCLHLTGTGLAWGLLAVSLVLSVFLAVRYRVRRRRAAAHPDYDESLDPGIWQPRRYERQYARRVGLFLAVALTVSFGCTAWLLETKLSYEPQLSLTGEDVKVTAVVTERLTDSSMGAHRCVLKVLDVQGHEEGKPVNRLRVLQFSSKHYTPHVGDVLTLKGTLFALGESDPSIQSYYKSQGRYLGLMTYSSVESTPLSESEVSMGVATRAILTVKGTLNRFRTRLTDSLFEWLPSRSAAVLSGMLTGDKLEMDEETKTLFQKAGVSHLFAVSGFHVSLWSMLLYKLLLSVGAGRKVSCVGAMEFLLLFVALTGFSRSAVRAGIMLAVFFLSRMLRETNDPLNSLGLAALVLLLGNPFYGGSTDLLLSYFATLGILSVYPKLMEPLRREYLMVKIPNYNIRSRVENGIAILLISTIVFVFTLPVVLVSFGAVSLVSPLTNLLVSSAASAAILCSGLGALFSLIPGVSLLSPWCFLLSGEAARFLFFACEKTAELPFSYVSLDSPSFSLGIGASIFLAAFSFVLYGTLPKDSTAERGYVRVTVLLCLCLLLSSILVPDLLQSVLS